MRWSAIDIYELLKNFNTSRLFVHCYWSFSPNDYSWWQKEKWSSQHDSNQFTRSTIMNVSCLQMNKNFHSHSLIYLSRIYAKTFKDANNVIPSVQRSHHPAAVMVCWRVSCKGVKPRHFDEKMGYTGIKVYQQEILEGAVKQLNKLSSMESIGFSSKKSCRWLSAWITSDLSLVYYRLWSDLEKMAYRIFRVSKNLLFEHRRQYQ